MNELESRAMNSSALGCIAIAIAAVLIITFAAVFAASARAPEIEFVTRFSEMRAIDGYWEVPADENRVYRCYTEPVITKLRDAGYKVWCESGALVKVFNTSVLPPTRDARPTDWGYKYDLCDDLGMCSTEEPPEYPYPEP